MIKSKLLIIFSIFHIITFAQQFDSALFSKLHFRFIGPDGNRVIAVVGEPGNPMVSYAGAASGGISAWQHRQHAKGDAGRGQGQGVPTPLRPPLRA